jgi:hypothetical protein
VVALQPENVGVAAVEDLQTGVGGWVDVCEGGCV